MSELVSDHQVIVTGEERAHPAIRKLARAMIALAKLKVGQSAPAPDGDTSAAGPEQAHD
jgi:hypothetical protein